MLFVLVSFLMIQVILIVFISLILETISSRSVTTVVSVTEKFFKFAFEVEQQALNIISIVANFR